LQKQLPGLKALGLQYAARGDAQQLQDDLIDAIFRHTLVDDLPPVRSAALFQERLEGRGQLFERGQRLVAALTEALKTATRIELLLAKLVSLPVQATRMDIDAQLQWLFRGRFVTQIEAPWLLSYARYLKAIDYRLDKLPGNLARETDNLAKVARFQARLTGLSSEQRRMAGEFEWLLQEYRVSLFAQPVGTRVPISEKRLEKAWTELESALR
jgi:ATP-dependent helicase HrpA